MSDNIITSVQNNKIKKIRSLNKKQIRDELSMFAAEGDKVVHDAIIAGLNTDEIFVLDTKLNKFTSLLELAQQKDIPITLVNEKVMSALSQTKSPQGVVAAFYKRTPKFSHDILDKVCFAAILEGIKDPGNLGTIIRTCDAVGVDIIIMQDCTDIYNNKVIRASMGSIFNIPSYDTSISQCATYMSKNNWQVACGHLNGVNFYDRVQRNKVALIIGNEARGITEATSKLCTDLWKLPMNGKADSLNASIAAGIMLYDINNKMHQ